MEISHVQQYIARCATNPDNKNMKKAIAHCAMTLIITVCYGNPTLSPFQETTAVPFLIPYTQTRCIPPTSETRKWSARAARRYQKLCHAHEAYHVEAFVFATGVVACRRFAAFCSTEGDWDGMRQRCRRDRRWVWQLTQDTGRAGSQLGLSFMPRPATKNATKFKTSHVLLLDKTT